MRRITSRAIGIVLCVALVSSIAAMPAAAQTGEERFLVELDGEGNADVSMTFVYDLNSEDEQAAFEELWDNETAGEETATRFENRMSAVAEDASSATDREMSVSDAAIEFDRDGNVGRITMSVAWSNLAAVDGDRLTVTEPFASGFQPDRPFTLTAPEGYGIASAAPDPSSSDEASATWEADTELEDFEVVVEQAEDTESTDDGSPDEGDTDDSPGFGVVAGSLALLAAALLAARKRQR
jgi:PGF-CTERM protein